MNQAIVSYVVVISKLFFSSPVFIIYNTFYDLECVNMTLENKLICSSICVIISAEVTILQKQDNVGARTVLSLL